MVEDLKAKGEGLKAKTQKPKLLTERGSAEMGS
jgi:hypothetical protein